jgi:hypothetical protein
MPEIRLTVGQITIAKNAHRFIDEVPEKPSPK